MTWASGLWDDAGFKKFLESLNVVKNANIVFFTHDMPEKVQKELSQIGKVEFVSPSEVNQIFCDRHLHYFNYLTKNKLDKVLLTDCRDVVFQTDPFDYEFKSKIVLVAEGIPPAKSRFHKIEQYMYQKDIVLKFLRDHGEFVLNGGILYGDAEAVKYHCRIIWFASLKPPYPTPEFLSPGYSDQAVLNYVYNFLKDDPDYYVADPEIINFCLTGEGYPYVNGVKYLDGIYYHSSGKPYSIVHQWDRIKHLSD